MTANAIRKDLKEIRYYYSRQSVFDKVTESVGKNAILDRITMYNELICNASPRLYDLYVSLYLQNNTQDSLSDKLGYTTETISRLHSRLIKFFQKEMSKKEENVNG